MLLWFRRNKNKQDLERAKKVTIEVEAHKEKAVKIAQKAEKSTKELNKLLRANGITLKIYIAAGGRH